MLDAVLLNCQRSIGVDAADWVCDRCELMRFEDAVNRLRIREAVLYNDAYFFGEERGERVVAERGDVEVYATAAGKRHLSYGGKETSV